MSYSVESKLFYGVKVDLEDILEEKEILCGHKTGNSKFCPECGKRTGEKEKVYPSWFKKMVNIGRSRVKDQLIFGAFFCGDDYDDCVIGYLLKEIGQYDDYTQIIENFYAGDFDFRSEVEKNKIPITIKKIEPTLILSLTQTS